MSAADLLLGLILVPTTLAVWIGCIAALRLPAARDRMHAVTFVTVAGGTGLTLAAFVADGVSIRSAKVLALSVALIFTSAALSHATGRALLIREDRRA